MKLEMIQGRETSLIIEDVIDSIKSETEKGFLSENYTKAFDAMYSYVKHSDKIRGEISGKGKSSDSNNILYRSPQNIIAFSGKRGSGKTSTMLSFSRAIGKSEKLKELCHHMGTDQKYTELENKNFIVLEPIDPTALENNQSILSVVLSRLLLIAEDIWNRNMSFNGCFKDKEVKKTELLNLARQCLNGISAIKCKKDIPSELSELQKVGDSAILKRNLYDFVDQLIQFNTVGTDVSQENCMLVLQIDDTDCQIGQGYDMMDDIRKYLTIPNVLILMATDTRILRQVLAQHYVSDFGENLKCGLIEAEILRNLGEKYMAKLLPPTRVVYLPNIDELIRDKVERMHLYYYKDDYKGDYKGDDKDDGEKCKTNLLDPGGKKYDEYEFQSVILRYIYKKTHIVFTSHAAYANNIIPTTLRGLAYLLSLLSSMKDVPEVDFNQKKDDQSDSDYLAKSLDTQCSILEKNLNLFEEYFMNDWIQVKLTQEMIDIVEKLSEQVADQRFSFIIKELIEYYRNKDKQNFISELDQFYDYLKSNSCSYQHVDELLRVIKGTKVDSDPEKSSRRQEDLYFIFAIRTIFTIKDNKDVLKVKRRTIDSYKLNPRNKIVFNYLKDNTSLPKGFYFDPVKLYGYDIVTEGQTNNSSDPNQKQKNDTAIIKGTDIKYDDYQYYFQSNVVGDVVFNFTGGIIEWLNPQEEDYKNLRQQKIYKVQELAVLMAANCEVQEVAGKAIARKAKEETDTAECLKDAVEKSFMHIQNEIAKINQDMFETYTISKQSEYYWKISDSIAGMLNKIGDKLSKSDTVNPKQGDRTYPRLESTIPYTKKGLEDYKKGHLIEYEKKLKKYFEDQGKSLDEESNKILEQMKSFDFKFEGEDLKNEKDFKEIEKSLYKLLDKLEAEDLEQKNIDSQATPSE